MPFCRPTFSVPAVLAALLVPGLLCLAAPAQAAPNPTAPNPTTPNPSDQEPLVLAPDQAVEATINGQSVRLRLAPDGDSGISLNPEAATRLALADATGRAEARIGPVTVHGRTVVARVTLFGRSGRQRVAWFDRPVAAGFDGEIGPGAIPRDVVVLRLAEPSADERTVTFRLTARDGQGLGTDIAIGRERVFVSWALDHREARASAATALALGEVHGGQFVGPVWREPVAFGVERPMRRLALGEPLVIGALRLPAVTVRPWDYGDASGMAVADAAPQDIVVTAPRPAVKPLHKLTLGQEALQGCSSIRFDKARRALTLSCRTLS